MCGISVIISNKITPSKINRFNDLIRHRGPDDEGYVFFNNTKSVCLGGVDTPKAAFLEESPYKPFGLIEEGVFPSNCYMAFGHRRLSIVDLSSLGHQPMCDKNQRYWITYNGEIYNFIELRLELEILGYSFLSHTDTEVILAAYSQWGEECLSHFNGMWAFAIYDKNEDILFVARDRFGVKPLYYWISPEGELTFASEIKQFTAMSSWRPKLNSQRTYDFLAWGLTDHTDETLFDRVFQLAPGCSLSFKVKDYLSAISKDGRLVAKRWYQITPRQFSGDFESAAVAFRQYLTDAVALRLHADVPVGSCLSGGLDSSSIVCLISQLLYENSTNALQKTFSACANVKRFDERTWIDEVVNATRVDAHYVYPEFEQLFDEISEITWHQDEPFGSTSIYAQWNVFREAGNNNVKVMLDGQGADEQLAGYHNFFSPHLSGLFKSFKWISLVKEMSAIHKIHGYPWLTVFSYFANGVLPEPVRDFLRRKTGKTNSSPEWLNTDILKCSPQNPIISLGLGRVNTIRELSIVQLTTSNLQMLLHWEDRNSMAHSIESRVPFLDYRLVEFVVGLPDEFKLSGGITKNVLRASMKDILPDNIRNRMDKLGFVTPEEVWMKEDVKGLFRNRLKAVINNSNGIIKKEALDFFDDLIDGKRPFSHMPWRLISFGEWLERFEVSLS
jgi:asparagine synthase (glutamine-hydrolysing)